MCLFRDLIFSPVHAESLPKLFAPNVTLPTAHLLDSSAHARAAQWWSGVYQLPTAAVGAVIRLQFDCPGFSGTCSPVFKFKLFFSAKLRRVECQQCLR